MIFVCGKSISRIQDLLASHLMARFQPVDGTLIPGFNPNLKGRSPFWNDWPQFQKTCFALFVIMIL